MSEDGERMTGSGRATAPSELRRVQLADQVVDRIRALIAQGALHQGERLPSEAALSREFGVGRSTVREALKVLGHLGLIQTRPGSGSYVSGAVTPPPRASRSLAELSELFEFRSALESQAAELAAERRTTGQLAEILHHLELLHAAAGADDPARLTAVDSDFHRSVVAASGNRYLRVAYEQHRSEFREGAAELIRMQASTHIADVHDDLAEAIVQQDPRRAILAVRRTYDEIRMRLALLGQNA